MKSQMLSIAIATSAALASAGANAFTVDVTVNALAQCVTTSDSTVTGGSRVSFQLPAGRYVASLVNNTMSCNGGNLSGLCAINTVIVQGFSPSGGGTGDWGASVKTPMVFEVPGSTAVQFGAFVLDSYCPDNTGQSTLRFQSVN